MISVRMAMFFVVMPLVWVALHVYLGRRLVGGSHLRLGWRRVAWGVVAIMGLLPPLTFVTVRMEVFAPSEAIQWLGFLFMGMSSIVFILLVAVDLLRLARKLILRLRRAPAAPDPSRRMFLGRAVNLGIVGGAGAVTGVGVVQAKQMPRVQEVEVPIEGLPAEAEGFRIVQISDVHVGPTIHGDFLSAVVDRVNELEPDMIAVTGDIVDGWVDDLRDEVASLARLKARHGAFFVTGNHEYYWDGPAWCEEFSGLGLTVLNNEHRVIEHDGARLLVAGVTDLSAGGMVASHASDPAAACHEAPEAHVRMLLAHQPRSVFDACKEGYDLQISGHTHGGQYFPMNMLVHLLQPYVSGLHLHEGTVRGSTSAEARAIGARPCGSERRTRSPCCVSWPPDRGC